MGVYTRKANWPVGSIVAIASTQVWSLPTAGQVKNGYALCDGNSYASLPSDTYNPSLTGNRPNLTDSRFLIGNTSIGLMGGVNTYTLTFSHLPQITTSIQSASHTHSWSGNLNTDSAIHIHECRTNGSAFLTTGGQSAGHTHASSTSSQNQTHTHMYGDSTWYGTLGKNAESAGSADMVGWNEPYERWMNSNTAQHGHTGTSSTTANHTHTVSSFSSGGISNYHKHTITQRGTGFTSDSHIHSYTNASLTSIDNKPSNLSVVFLIRVK